MFRVGPYSNISRMARDTCVAEGKPRKQAERGQSSALRKDASNKTNCCHLDPGL